MGIRIPDINHWPWPEKPEDECYYNHRDSLMPGCVTGSEDGQAVAPLKGDFTDYDGGFTYFGVGPSSFFLAYPDHGMMYLFLPRSVQVTDMEVLWLVRNDAQEGEDYDRDRLTWMWDVTSIADKHIIDNNQKGVNSRFYTPGPYQQMEAPNVEFIRWYLKELGRTNL